MTEDFNNEPTLKLPSFTLTENGMCPGSQAKRMRQFERENNSNANAIWSEWVLPNYED